MHKDDTLKVPATKITRVSGPGDNMRWIIALGAALCAVFAITHAQAWETIDDVAGATSEKVNSVTSDSAGNNFTVGTVVDATTADTFSMAANQNTMGRAITRDPAGNLFAIGNGYDAAAVYHGWLVRQSRTPKWPNSVVLIPNSKLPATLLQPGKWAEINSDN